jgi:phospholipase D
MRNATRAHRPSLPVGLLFIGCSLLLSPPWSGRDSSVRADAPPLRPAAPLASVYFWPSITPGQPNLEEIALQQIAKAQTRFWVLAYVLTDPVVADALLSAAGRGVQVLVLLDESQEKDADTQAVFLQNKSILVMADHRGGLDRNKVLLVDGEATTGSANLSVDSLTHDAGNLLTVRDASAVADYSRYFDLRWTDTATLPFRYHGLNPARRQQ